MSTNPYLWQQMAREKRDRYQYEARLGRLELAGLLGRLSQTFERWRDGLEGDRPGSIPGYPEGAS